MEPKDSDKKFEDLLKHISFSFTIPVGIYKINQPVETVDETLVRLDKVDETVAAMDEYPQAKKMLDKLYGKM